MICPRCGKEVPDNETICPFCFQLLNNNMEFNNFRKDGFIALKKKENNGEKTETSNFAPKYFRLNELNIFVIAIVFVLSVGLLTVFGLKLLQTITNADSLVPPLPTTEYVTTEPTTEEPTEATIKNTVKDVSIKNVYGSWRMAADEESASHAIPYFSFSSDGKAQQNLGSITRTGEFKDLSNKKDNVIYIKISGALTGTFNFDVTGNSKDGYSLVLSSINTYTEHYLTSTTAKFYNPTPIQNFKMDKGILGKWVNDDESRVYKFTDDGRMSCTKDNTTIDGVWSIYEDNKITVQYLERTMETIELDYKLAKGHLIINDNIYTKE